MYLTFAFIFNTLLVILAILIHYEVLFWMDKKLPRIAHLPPRFRVLVGVGVLFLTHIVEIWLFGIGYYCTLQMEGMGHLIGQGLIAGQFLDHNCWLWRYRCSRLRQISHWRRSFNWFVIDHLVCLILVLRNAEVLD